MFAEGISSWQLSQGMPGEVMAKTLKQNNCNVRTPGATRTSSIPAHVQYACHFNISSQVQQTQVDVYDILNFIDFFMKILSILEALSLVGKVSEGAVIFMF